MRSLSAFDKLEPIVTLSLHFSFSAEEYPDITTAYPLLFNSAKTIPTNRELIEAKFIAQHKHTYGK